MTRNLPAIVRDLAAAVGIPDILIPAVVHRAEMARLAVMQATGYAVLGSGVDRLARNVVANAARDHARGFLERRVLEFGPGTS